MISELCVLCLAWEGYVKAVHRGVQSVLFERKLLCAKLQEQVPEAEARERVSSMRQPPW